MPYSSGMIAWMCICVLAIILVLGMWRSKVEHDKWRPKESPYQASSGAQQQLDHWVEQRPWYAISGVTAALCIGFFVLALVATLALPYLTLKGHTSGNEIGHIGSI